jgi:hypothetical protein
METVKYIAFLRFSMQLILSESIFLLGRPKREKFGLRRAVSFAGYLLSGSGWYWLIHLLPWEQPMVKIMFWLGLFALTLPPIALSFQLSPIEILFVGTGGYATEHIAFSLAKMVQFLTDGYEENIGPVLENLIFRFLFYIGVAVLVYFLLIRKNKSRDSFRPHDRRLTLLALAILIVVIILSVFYGSAVITPQRTIITEVLCPIYAILCCLLALLLEYSILHLNRMELDQGILEQMLRISTEQQRNSKEAIDIINMKCHDLKHQIRALAAMDNAKERLQYVSEVQQAVSIYDATYHTGCDALDYVLQEKTLLFKEHQVAFSCMAEGEVINFMRVADLYALLGNALDNALERMTLESPERRIISLQIKHRGQMALVHLENPCSTPLEFQDGLPITHKEDKNLHGFGVKSIRYIAEKYDGQVRMRTQDGIFSLDVMLPIPQTQTIA